MHWGYLTETLDKFGINGWVASALLSLYSTSLASVLVSGARSKLFPIRNGTCQGCPLSPIFALFMEPLAIKIKEPPLIAGIEVGPRSHRMSLYADDVIIIVMDPDKSLRVTYYIL